MVKIELEAAIEYNAPNTEKVALTTVHISEI
jgi:hypothetical protein